MKAFAAVCLSFASCVCTARADDAPQGDLAKMQGKWKAMAGPERNIPLTMTIKGSAVTLAFTTPQGQDRELKGQIKLDETAKPKTWDWTKFTRPDGDLAQENLAIYELDGDSLKICSGGPGNERPSAFKAGDGGPPNLIVFHRQKGK